MKGQGRRVFTISTYINKRSEQRLAVQMPYTEALLIASGDDAALVGLVAAIKKRVELEEGRAADDL